MDYNEIKALKEERANVWEAGKALLDEVHADSDGGWTAERDEKWSRIEADIARLDKVIDREESFRALDRKEAVIDEARKEATGTSKDEYDATFRKYLKDGVAGLEVSERKVLQGGLVNFAGAEGRALGVATGGAGGYTVPEGFWNKVTEARLAFGGVATVANIITTETGQDLPWMTNDDTANKGAILAEGVAISEQDVSFATKSLGAYLYTSKLVRVSYQLLQDSSIDIESFLSRKFAERLARIHNDHYTTGTGTAQPDGIVTGATTGKTTAGATAITYNEIVDLIHSVDPAYRSAPNVQFMFSDGILGYLRKVRDDSGGSGLGRPLWEPSVQVGAPSTIHGYGYTVNQSMSGVSSGAPITATTSVLFGDFHSGYVIRRVRGLQTIRLDERYAEYLQVGFFAFDREDGTKDDTAAYKALVQA